MKNFLLVGIGGCLGSIARYSVSLLVSRYFITIFPLSTFLVNIIGSFLIGLLYGWLEQFPQYTLYRLFLVTGFCGGFTTFSALSIENLSLLQKGYYMFFLTYTLGSIVLGIIAAYLGIMFNKHL
ncbi:MAG: putative fluoride ion transporter CrcB [Bacteroidia bacterium]|nr:MAG: putative fluoride ion transporter CrcB [Bacteroidia bacterium]